jgi:hypothetical protein
MRKIFNAIIILFALIGLIFVCVFIALRLGWTNVKGSISERNNYFQTAIAYKGEGSALTADSVQSLLPSSSQSAWAQSEEWALMKEVFTRDQATIQKASADSGVPARLILATVIGEQFRFLSSRREAFKSYFEPLKILPSLSNISYGIAGIKPKTAGLIEDNLKNPESKYYLGPNMSTILDYATGVDVESARMDRITNSKDAYYSYLYVGLYLKQIETQWGNAGYNIDNRADILATLYNLGFYYSVPNADPKPGGAVIHINGSDYTYGDLAQEFYSSSELSDIFPIVSGGVQ